MPRSPFLVPLVCLGTLLIACLTFVAGLAVGAHMAEARLIAMLQEDPTHAEVTTAGLQVPVPRLQGGSLRMPQAPQLRMPQVRAPQLRGPQFTGGQLRGPQLTGGQLQAPQLRMPGGGLTTPTSLTVGGTAAPAQAGMAQAGMAQAEMAQPGVPQAGLPQADMPRAGTPQDRLPGEPDGPVQGPDEVVDEPMPPPAVAILPALHDASLREEVAARMRAVPASLDVVPAEEPPPATAAETLAASLQGALAPAGMVADDEPGYTVELAIFRELANARALERDLRGSGHPVRVVIDDPTLEHPWYAITLGHYATRRLAEQAAYRIWRSDGLHGSVILVYPADEVQG